MQIVTAATHFLGSQRWVSSAGSKHSSPRKLLTNWRVEERHCEQGPNTVHNGGHSQTGKPRTGVVSRVQTQLTTEATHILENQGQASSAGSKCSPPQKLLTCWRAKDRHCEQVQNAAHHRSHSLAEKPGTGIISRVQIQLTTYFLERQRQVLLAGSKSSSPWKPLTFWRTENSRHEQDPNVAHYGCH